jgi:hypothetical protein
LTISLPESVADRYDRMAKRNDIDSTAEYIRRMLSAAESRHDDISQLRSQ